MKNTTQLFKINKTTTTFLKGIAILFVLFGHQAYIFNSGAFGVNIFLIISGYGIFSSYLKNNNKNYFAKKIKKVYLPYLMVTITTLLFYVYSVRYKISKKIILFSLLGLDFTYIYDKTMWYISFIFYQYILFYIICFILSKINLKKFKENSNIKHYLIIFLDFILNIIIYKYISIYNVWSEAAGVFLYIYAFPIGLFISKIGTIKINKQKKEFIVRTVLWMLLIILFCFYSNTSSNKTYIVYAIALPLFLIFLNELKLFKFKNKYIEFFGKYSYDIYLWEGFILTNRNKWFYGFKYQILIDIVATIVIIVISVYFKKIIIDYFLNFKERNFDSSIYKIRIK